MHVIEMWAWWLLPGGGYPRLEVHLQSSSAARESGSAAVLRREVEAVDQLG